MKLKGFRLAALVLVVTGAAFFISCQDQAGPTPAALNETDAFSVRGTCYDLLNRPTSNITCKVYCETHSQFIYTVYLSNPTYTCVPAPPDYATHEDCWAHAEGYNPWGRYWGKSATFRITSAGNNADIYEQ